MVFWTNLFYIGLFGLALYILATTLGLNVMLLIVSLGMLAILIKRQRHLKAAFIQLNKGESL